ncbi:Short-chain dehydrogenase/reductase SDR [Neofusicoccum parvum]|uniref:Short-chain dehydrogenase/reductase 3 n=1 Tax=Botryosphaeria parva (strain UCR-NP2) TaxID=1287680 RepID=R1ECD1_BOTPV|nr:putative dehydrogenase reductase sdr family member 8 precursor protein [Neofusicoccum parvum UCRNP2]GME64896.1 Short-chain dehydrogenase/reductase SDR [Neofusicoccum parvum]
MSNFAMSKRSQALINLSGPVAAAVVNPLFTAPLLWLLTKAPGQFQEPALRQLARLPASFTVPRIVSALKWLVVFGVVDKLNGWLSSLATNGWSVRSDADRWIWPREVAVVTGGCSGIGEVVVKGLVEKGVKVAILDVQPLPKRLEHNLIFYQRCDITDADAVSHAADQIKSTIGNPSILVNNAGIGASHTIIETTPEELNKIFGVNLLSHWYTCRAFLPNMIKHDKGHVVTVASMASFVTVASITDYAATKSGALAFHEGLTQELRHRHNAPNVHTTVVHPNWTKTPLVADHADHLERNQGQLLTADFVGGSILKQIFGCRGDQLILPRTFKNLAGIRGWPHWLQERVRDGVGKIGTGDELKQ